MYNSAALFEVEQRCNPNKERHMKALIFWGGWDGHTPEQTSQLLANELRAKGVDVVVANSQDCLGDLEALKKFDVIIPQWTMGAISDEHWANLNKAVREFGVGFAGCHGGTGDAFRANLEYQWMVGGHFVGHPFVDEFAVQLTGQDPITEGLPPSFPYKSEQYYMMTDPGIRVLANTPYDYDGQITIMPVVWTKQWGKGRVFYSALGHSHEELLKYPAVVAMTIRGFMWAAKT